MSFFLSCNSKLNHINQIIYLKNSWFLQNSEFINCTGKDISGKDFNTHNWYPAQVPSTIMGALTKNGLYPDVFIGDNLSKVPQEQFDSSWWYRTEFKLSEIGNRIVNLNFDGISYYANIWLNGKLIASRDIVFGSFRRFNFNITDYIYQGQNVLAIEIFKQQPGDFGLGFVDWNPRPPDENMGIWREVYIKITDQVSLQNTFVKSKVNLKTLDEAWLTISTELKNYSSKAAQGKLNGKINDIEFSVPVKLNPKEHKEIILTSEQIPEFHILNPKLWWCNNLGEPNLYQLKLQFIINNQISDEEEVNFGIREIEKYYNEKGYTGFKLNGKKVLIKGAGWTDDIFLQNTNEKNEIQVQYVKHMNLNTIRFENIWGTSHNIYNLCDKYGIMAMVGWSCQWEWESYLGKPCNEYGGANSVEDIKLLVQYLNDQVKWLRNHPSIIVWMLGSDKIPNPELEKRYTELLNKIDNRPYLAAARNYKSSVSGETGVKMNGPYEYVAPDYWYIDIERGGAFGFNTETGPGPQIPDIETIKKMIPENSIWPISETWNYHCCKGEEFFNNLTVFNKALENRYGETKDLRDYLLKAKIMNYEAMRSMFEAFRVNIHNTTGIIQWMLNSAWPSFYWQLYDYYLIPTAAYYAAKKADEPIQLIYNYGNNSVYLVNESKHNLENINAKIQVFSFYSEEILTKEKIVNIQENSSQKIEQLDELKDNSFLLLQIFDKIDNLIADNFYWLSVKKDEFDWENPYWAYTPMKKYADFKDLQNLPKATVKYEINYEENEENRVCIVDLTNTSNSIAFFIEIKLVNQQNELINPVFWEDNYFSILPNSSKSVSCRFDKKLFDSSEIIVKVEGWNFE